MSLITALWSPHKLHKGRDMSALLSMVLCLLAQQLPCKVLAGEVLIKSRTLQADCLKANYGSVTCYVTQANNLTFLCLSVLICNIRIRIIPTRYPREMKTYVHTKACI